jgi:acetolactate synthase I/II/III large subunit
MTPRPSRGHLGVKLARPDAQVISILRDGSYIFSNPVAVHYASTMHKLPVLTIVINNAMWGAVRRATLGMYPDGEAAKSNKPPFIDLDDLPAFETICEASGGYGERVEDPAGCCDGTVKLTEPRANLGREATSFGLYGRQAMALVLEMSRQTAKPWSREARRKSAGADLG